MSDITADYSFGGWIRQLRLKRKLTLRAAAKRLDMDAGNLSKLERSELDPPCSAAKVEFIAKKLGFSKTGLDLLLSAAYAHHLGELHHEFDGQTRRGLESVSHWLKRVYVYTCGVDHGAYMLQNFDGSVECSCGKPCRVEDWSDKEGVVVIPDRRPTEEKS